MTFVRPEAGHYYRRIYRGQDMVFDLADEQVRTATGVAVQTLCSDLRGLFEVVTPDHPNLGSYGTRIRQTLILACTEVPEARSHATLGYAIAAVGAMLVMAAAQFGNLLFGPDARFGQTVFLLYPPVEWHIPRAGYIPPPAGESWKATPYPFDNQSRQV